MHLGIDIDGVLSKRSPIQGSYVKARIFLALVRILPGNVGNYWFLHRTEVRDDIEVARQLSQTYAVTVITARPQTYRHVTEQWLSEQARLSFCQLSCVGLAKGVPQRKYQHAQEAGVDLVIDDTDDIVKYLQDHGMAAHLFTSWKEARSFVEARDNS
jgi:uncharacterized HAD superfamily protein